MWLREWLKPRPTSASIAHQRLRLAISQQRAEQQNPDFVPRLRRDLLHVLRKYVEGQPQEVRLLIDRESEHDTLEFSVTFRGGSFERPHA